ncbi:hypothetical protein B0H19DRAFT_1245726 [Mycena capillaripes]|nr:hypothetical protein B0H19DRAFT_1245726 [Mycena capillaripes]
MLPTTPRSTSLIPPFHRKILYLAKWGIFGLSGQVSSIAHPTAPDGVRPIIPPPRRRRLLNLRASFRPRGDQDCHDSHPRHQTLPGRPPRYAYKAAFPLVLWSPSPPHSSRLVKSGPRLLADSVASFTTQASLSLCYAPVRLSPASRLLFSQPPVEALAAILKTTRALDVDTPQAIEPSLVWKAVLEDLYDSRPRTWLVICLEAGPRRALLRKRVEERNGFPRACNLPGSRSSSCPAEEAGGGAKWVYLSPPGTRRARPFRSVASRCCSALLALSADDSPHPFCVDENPRLRACTAWDCLQALRTHIASLCTVAYLGRSYDTSRYTPHARTMGASFLHSRCARTLIPILTTKTTSARNPDDLPPPPIPLPRISCVAHRSSPLSTPTTLERRTTCAPISIAACCAQARSSARDPRHDLEAVTCALQRARRSARVAHDAAVPPRARRLLRLPAHATLFSSIPSTALRLKHALPVLPCTTCPRLQRAPWPFPIASAAFVESSRSKSAAEHGEGSAQDCDFYLLVCIVITHSPPIIPDIDLLAVDAAAENVEAATCDQVEAPCEAFDRRHPSSTTSGSEMLSRTISSSSAPGHGGSSSVIAKGVEVTGMSERSYLGRRVRLRDRRLVRARNRPRPAAPVASSSFRESEVLSRARGADEDKFVLNQWR